MKILAIGDVVGAAAVTYLKENLWKQRDRLGADFTVVNGENAANIHGISPNDARDLLDAGADLITLGNHTYGRRDFYSFLSDSNAVIRPANYPPLAPGAGYAICSMQGYRLLCINILGTALMEPLACPFATVDAILKREAGQYDSALLDIHAEATSEKLALARYFDGRIPVMFGTHTHVQTADEQILPCGSGYITDLGMTGPTNGIIGSEPAAVIERFRTKMPAHFQVADGPIQAQGALFELDPSNLMQIRNVQRIRF